MYESIVGKSSSVHKYYVLRRNEPSNLIPAHLYKDANYAALCPAIIETLVQQRGNQRSVNQTVAKVVDFDQLSKDFVDFWTDSGDRKKAERRYLFKNAK